MEYLIGFIVCEMVLVLVLMYFFITFQKQIRIKNSQIHALQQENHELQVRLKEKERRNAYRVQLLEQTCKFEFINFGDKALEKLINRKGEGKIRDISRTGMKLICNYDLPVRKKVFLQLHFVLFNEEFSLKGKIVRKEELMNDIVYGIEFMEINSTDKERLYRLIQRAEINRRKKL